MTVGKRKFIFNMPLAFVCAELIGIFFMMLYAVAPAVLAAEKTFAPDVISYEMSESSDYNYTYADAVNVMSYGNSTIGKLTISGSVDKESSFRNVKAYGVTENVSFSYEYDGSYQTNNKTDWNIVSDSGTTVAGYSLNSKIKMGALIVEKSFDGKTWNRIADYTDFFWKNKSGLNEFITTTDNDIRRGVYYRITVAYKMGRKIGTKGFIWDWNPIKEDVFEYKKCAEVYTFYICYDKNAVLIKDMVDRTDISSKTQTTYGFFIDKCGSSDRVDVIKDGENLIDIDDGQMFSKAGKYTIKTISKLGDKYEHHIEILSGLKMTELTPLTYSTDYDYSLPENLFGKETVYGARSISNLLLAQKTGDTITISEKGKVNSYGIDGDSFWIFIRLNYGKNLTSNGWGLCSDTYGKYENETIQGVTTGQVDSGALIIQTSADGENWENVDKDRYSKGLYTTDFCSNYPVNNAVMLYMPDGSDIVNGIYIRILLAYEVGNGKDTKNYLEEYKFYLCNGNLNSVTFHNLSVADKIEELLSEEDNSTVDIYKHAETLLSDSLTVTGFTIDKSLNQTISYDIYKNGRLLTGNQKKFTETGRYDIYLKSKVGTKKHVTIYVDRESSQNSMKMYFGDSFIKGKRIYDDRPYPVFEGGFSQYNICAVSDEYLPVSGVIKNVSTGTEIVIDATRDEKTAILYEPGEYIATLTTNPSFLTDRPSGDTKIFTFHFYIIPKGTAPGPQVNKQSLEEYSHTNISDSRPIFYGLTYSSAASGNITLAFATREEAYNYAYNYEKGIVEKQSDGSFRYTGSLKVAQKEKFNSSWDLADALDYFANQAIQVLYFDLSDEFTYTTLSDDVISTVDNLRTLELKQSVVIFGDGQREKLTQTDGLIILSPKPCRYLSAEKGGGITSFYNDFQFVKDKYGYDSSCVVIRDCNGKEYNIEYNKGVGAQLAAAGCPSGVVTIIENNIYGDKSEYNAAYINENDNTTSLQIRYYAGTDEKQIAIDSRKANGQIAVDAFSIESITDCIDNYPLVLIIKYNTVIQQYTSDSEMIERFSLPGDYTIRCINRLGYSFEYFITVNGDTDYSITISFSGEETEYEKPILAYLGQKNVELPSISRYGYILTGFKDANGVIYNDEIDRVMYKGSVVLEAVWQAKQFNVQFIDQNNCVVDTITVDYGSEFQMPVIADESTGAYMAWRCGDVLVLDNTYRLSQEGDLVFTAVSKDGDNKDAADNAILNFIKRNKTTLITACSALCVIAVVISCLVFSKQKILSHKQNKKNSGEDDKNE